MTREHRLVLTLDEFKEALTGAFQQFEKNLREVFGEFVYRIDTVIDRYNALEATQAEQARQLATISERLLALERAFGNREH